MEDQRVNMRIDCDGITVHALKTEAGLLILGFTIHHGNDECVVPATGFMQCDGEIASEISGRA
jgi:hypothetical protein